MFGIARCAVAAAAAHPFVSVFMTSSFVVYCRFGARLAASGRDTILTKSLDCSETYLADVVGGTSALFSVVVLLFVALFVPKCVAAFVAV